jgi:parallel beta-helix repeat protein
MLRQPGHKNSARFEARTAPERRAAKHRSRVSRFRKAFPKFSLSRWSSNRIVDSLCQLFRHSARTMRAVTQATGTTCVGLGNGRMLRVESLESRQMLAADVWVNDNWTVTFDHGVPGLSVGDEVTSSVADGSHVKTYGLDAFGTTNLGSLSPYNSIQDAIDLVDINNIYILGGSYNESLTVDKSLNIFGQGATNTTLNSGPLTTAITVVDGANVDVESLTITGGIFGIDVEEGDLTVRHAVLTGGSAVGALVDNDSQLTVVDSNLQGAGSGVGVAVVDGNATITGSIISGRTDGVVIGADGQATLHGNNLTNSFSGIGKAIQANPSAGIINASGNYWGTSSETAIDGMVLGSVDISPYLIGGTNTATGFAGNFSVLHVTKEGDQSGSVGRIQEGVDEVLDGGTVNVNAGTFTETVTFNNRHGIDLLGAGAGSTFVVGPSTSPGNSATIRLTNATGNLIDGLTITRNDNTAATWHPHGMVFGVLFDAGANSNTLQNSHLTDNRTAIDIRSASGNVIQDNRINENRTGIVIYDLANNNLVQRNEIVDNFTMGVLFFDETTEATGNQFVNNNISGNWYSQVEDRRAAGAVRDMSGNWFGTNDVTTTLGTAGEPGYIGMVPTKYPGGTATAPMILLIISGPGSHKIDYTAWLDSDTDYDTGLGFDGDFSVLHVDDNSAQSGVVGRITEGLALLDDSGLGGGTLIIHAGTYTEDVSTVGTEVTLVPGASPAQIILNGNLTLDSNDTLVMELDGTDAATEYDNFVVNGTIDLGDATLVLSRGFDPFPGDEFIILSNDDSEAVSGTFSGLAEGSIITLAGIPFTLSYAGGSNGNDVTLTVAQPNIVWANDTWVEVSNSSGGIAGVVEPGDIVDSDTGAGDASVTGKIFGYNAFSSIQSSIDAVSVAGTVNVLAGTYNESPSSTKSVQLLGANAGINPNTGSRGAESIIQATDFWGVYFENSSGLVIDGFTIDGGGVSDYGIYIYTNNGAGGATVQNNIVENFTTYGFVGYSPSAASSNNQVAENKFETIGDRAIVTLWNYYADITQNVISDTDVGIYAENSHVAEATGDVVWSGNEISARRAGIWYNLAYSSATPITISDNEIAAEDDNTLTRFSGVWITSIGGNLAPSISDNDITIGAISQLGVGYDLWNNTTTAINGISISGGEVNGADYGVWANNFDGYPTLTGSDGGSMTVSLSGMVITGSALAGVFVKDSANNTNSAAVHVTVSNSTISGGGDGIKVEGSDASVTISGATDIFDNTIGIEVLGASAEINGANIHDNGVGIDIRGASTLELNGGSVSGNATNGLLVIGDGSYQSIAVAGTTFSGNAANGPVSMGQGDITLFDFAGPVGTPSEASFIDVVVDSDNPDYAIQVRGRNGATLTSNVGSTAQVTFDGVEITGTQNRMAMLIQQYADLSGFSFEDVVFNSAADGGLVIFTAAGLLDLGNTTFHDSYDSGDGVGDGTGVDIATSLNDIDATDVTFLDASDIALDKNDLQANFAIEDRVGHSVDASVPVPGGAGFVDWVGSGTYANAVFLTTESFAPVAGTTSASVERAIEVADIEPGKDHLYIQQGNYVQNSQIVIDTNVQVIGDPLGKPVITPGQNFVGANTADAWILVNSGVTFGLENVVLDGDGFAVWQALRSHGNTTITDVDFRDIKGSASGSPYRGAAIQSFGGTVAGGAGADSHGSGAAASHLVVSGSTFEEIGRIGVLVKGTGATASIEDIEYTGKGTGDWLDYAIEVGAGAIVDIEDATITGNLGVASDSSTSAGILITTFWGAGSQANLSGNNDISGNTVGVHIGFNSSDSSVVTIEGGSITGNTAAGINAGGSGVEVMIQEVDLTGNLVGIVVDDDAEVDAGGGNLGSTGGNILSGYTGVAGNYAIENLNLDASLNVDVYAQDNDFGTAVPTAIEQVIFHTVDNATYTEVFFTPAIGPVVPGVVYVNDDWVGTGLGDDPDALYANGNAFGTDAFASIQDAIDAVGTNATIYVLNGTYDEAVVINKAGTQLLHLDTLAEPVDPNSATEATITRTTGMNSVVVEVTADDVTIDGFHIIINRPNSTVGIGASNATSATFTGGSFDDLTITNNVITTTGDGGSVVTPGFLTTAVSGIALVGNGTPYESVHIEGNTVDLTTSGTGFQRRAVWLREVEAVVRDNDLTGVANDLIVQFAASATSTPTVIEDNDFYSGGVDITENSSSGSVHILGNRFQITTPSSAQSLVLKNDDAAAILVQGNTFTGHLLGISMGTSSGVTIDDNSFTPLTGFNTADIVLDTANFTGGSPSAPFNPLTATITNNEFFGQVDANNHVAIALYNRNPGAASPDYGLVTVGGVGNENIFHDDLDTYIYLDPGVLSGAPAIAGAPVTVDIDASNNKFEVTGGTLGGDLPADMDLAQLFELEDKIVHSVDVGTLGFVTVRADEVFVSQDSFIGPFTTTASIQRGVNAADAGDSVFVQGGAAYNENVSITKDLNLIGEAGTTTIRPLAGGTAITISGSGFGDDETVSIQNFNFDGQLGTGAYGIRVVSTAVFDRLIVENGDFTGMNYVGVEVLGDLADGISVANVELTNLTFSNNGIVGNTGGVGDISFFDFNGNATLTDLTLVGNRVQNLMTESLSTGARSGIQFRGASVPGNGPTTGQYGVGVLPMGTIVLDNVDISGKYRNQMLAFQRYTDTDISFTDVQLGGATSEITHTFGASLRFDAIGFGDINTPVNLDLGNTHFRGLSGSSAQRHELEIAPDNLHTFLMVDGKNTIWSGIDAADLTLSQAFDVEDRILHYVDKLNAGHIVAFGGQYKGFVEILDGQAFVTDSADAGVVGDGSITRAVDVVDIGGTVHVEAGSYTENVIVDRYANIIGAGSGLTVLNQSTGPNIITLNASGLIGTPLTIEGMQLMVAGVDKQGISIGANVGPVVSVEHVLIDDLRVTGTNPVGGAIQEIGLRIWDFGDVDNLVIQNSIFENMTHGMITEKHADMAGTTNVTNVTITDTQFLNNRWKGFYAEKLSDATFTDVSAIGNGNYNSFNSGSGIEINLKGNNVTYENLIFNNLTVTNNGNGVPVLPALPLGAGLQFKARGSGIDSGTYMPFPAELTNVQIIGGTFDGNRTAIRVGEPGQGNDSPTGVVIDDVTITNSTEKGIHLVGGSTRIENSDFTNNPTGILVQSAGQGIIDNNTFSGGDIDVDVNGGTALVQGSDFTGTIGVKVQGGIVDLGQTGAPSPSNYTGLGISTGGNDFSAYTSSSSAAGAIVVTATDSAAGPQGYPADIAAFGNTFSPNTVADAEAAIYHDGDNTGVRFVDFAATLVVTNATLTDSVNEGGEATFIIEFSNESQEHTLVIDWGDGSGPQEIDIPAGVFTWEVDHTYVDDNPSNTSSDILNFSYTLTDSGTGSVSANDTITVNNVAPVLLLDPVLTIDENGIATLSGTITDPGTADTFTVLVDWGDGNPAEEFIYNAGTTVFSETHQYLDDNPSITSSDDYTISVLIEDDDLGLDAAATLVTVNNVAPTVDAGSDQTVNEGTEVNLSGLFGDVGTEDTHTFSWTVMSSNGQVIPVGNAQNFSFTPNDNGTYTATFTVTDDDGGVTSDTVEITVDNVTPILVLDPVLSVDENGIATLSGTIIDPGTADTFTVVVDWGDGSTPEEFTYIAGTTVFSETHQYLDDNPSGTSSDVYSISVTLSDDEDDSDTELTSITVDNVAPTVNAGADQAVNEGSLVNLNGLFGDVGTEDTHVFNWTVIASNGQVIAPGSGQNFSFTANDNGTYTATFTVTDDDGGVASDTVVITVNDVAPAVFIESITTPINENTSTSLQFRLVDPGAGDLASTVQVSINWGDSSPPTVINSGPQLTALQAGNAITISHIYADDSTPGTSSDTYNITFSSIQSLPTLMYPGMALALGSSSNQVQVDNVAPTGIFVTTTPSVSAGSSVSVNWVAQSDPSSADLAGLRYTYFIDANNSGGFDTGEEILPTTTYGDGTYAGSTASASVVLPGSYFMTPGTVRVGSQIRDNDGGVTTEIVEVEVTATTFQILSMTPTASGFIVEFNRAASPDEVNLYAGRLNDTPTSVTTDGSDVILIGDSGVGTVRGSLVWNSDYTSFEFVATGGILAPATYSLLIESGDSAFEDEVAGEDLDGDYDLFAGGNFTDSFTVNPTTARVVSIPDFARGATDSFGQSVSLPFGNSTAGIPVRISNGSGVTSIDFDVVFDSTLLTITDVELGADPSAGAITYNFISPNRLRVTVSSIAGLDPGSQEIVRLIASVPADAPYGGQHVLRIENLEVFDNLTELLSVGDMAIHKAIFIGDATANGTYTGQDAGWIAEVRVGTHTGFGEYPLTDPVIIADVNQTGTIDAQDSTWVSQKGINAAIRPEIPNIPAGVVTLEAGVDPIIALPLTSYVVPGATASVPLSITDSAAGLIGFNVTVGYNTALIDLPNGLDAGGIAISGMFDAEDNWNLTTYVDEAAGTIDLSFYRSDASVSTAGEIASLSLDVSSSLLPGDIVPLTVGGPANDPPFSYQYFGGNLVVTYTADFDLDGDVDGDDLPLWQAGYGTGTGATTEDGDADGDGDVDGRDYITWMRQFGGDLTPLVAVAVSNEEPQPIASLTAESPNVVNELISSSVDAFSALGSVFEHGSWVALATTNVPVSTSNNLNSDLSSVDAAFSDAYLSNLEATTSVGEIDFGIEDTVLETEEDDTELELDFAEECDAVFEAWM